VDSYDVRFWDIKKLGNGTAARYRVRWAVDGREHCKSFKARPLADGFLDGLKDAVRDRRPFNPSRGLPEAETTEGEMTTWYQHARAYSEAKWGSLAPVSRRSVAEALVTVTIALTSKEPGAPEPKVLRQALFAWAFNPATRDTDPPEKIAAALDWAERASLPVSLRSADPVLSARQVILDADGTRAQVAQCRPGEQRPGGLLGRRGREEALGDGGRGGQGEQGLDQPFNDYPARAASSAASRLLALSESSSGPLSRHVSGSQQVRISSSAAA
jgi:hypothetical protein